MTIFELAERFNENAEKYKFDIKVTAVKTLGEVTAEAKEKVNFLFGDERIKGMFAGTMQITDFISATIVANDSDGGNVTGLELVMSTGDILHNLECYKAIVLMLECFTTMNTYRRNDILKRLGLHNGSFKKKQENREHGLYI